ncbi:MAG: hypothetical protein ACW99Q_03690, partial [Candidatus Kariarchaeaceae archaeon]
MYVLTRLFLKKPLDVPSIPSEIAVRADDSQKIADWGRIRSLMFINSGNSKILAFLSQWKSKEQFLHYISSDVFKEMIEKYQAREY